MSNTDNTPATMTFTAPKSAWVYMDTAWAKLVNCQLNTPYKVLGKQFVTKANDYGTVTYTYLTIQRQGGSILSLPWGKPDYVAYA